MSQSGKINAAGKQVAVIVGATSKWQSDGRNTLLAHGRTLDDSGVAVGKRWGVGGAIAQKFAGEGFFTVLTTRSQANASPLAAAIRDPETWSSTQGVVPNGFVPAKPTLIVMDAPDHASMRNAVNRAFTPRRIDLLAPRIRRFAQSLVDSFPAEGELDAFAAFIEKQNK